MIQFERYHTKGHIIGFVLTSFAMKQPVKVTEIAKEIRL